MQNEAVGVVMPSKQTMDELLATAAALNQASDDLNELIENIEDQLQRAGLGITHWVGEGSYEPSSCLLAASKSSVPDAEDHLVADGWMLGHAKVEGKWRIAVKRVEVDIYPRATPDEQEHQRDVSKAMPLLKAPREVRVESASMLEDLAQGLTQRMKQHLEDIARAKSLAQGEYLIKTKQGEYVVTTTANLVEACRQLGFMGEVKVYDTRMVKSDLDEDVLYVWRAESGQGYGADPAAAARQAAAAIGKFFGRYRERSAMGDSLPDLLENLGIELRAVE